LDLQIGNALRTNVAGKWGAFENLAQKRISLALS